MNHRNWLELPRLLVDGPDLDYDQAATATAIANALAALAGEGVLPTALYPSPFGITKSGSVLGGTVGNGIGLDPNGQLVVIPAGGATSNAFLCTTADPTNARWDLLVLEYLQTGDTVIPDPDDLATNVFLNLHDDFLLKVIAGTPAGSPAYPSKGALDIVLCGLKVPAAATLGTSITVDLTQRETCQSIALKTLFTGTNATLAFPYGRRLANTPGGGLSDTLPLASSNPNYAVEFANVGTGVLTITPNAADKIQGGTTGVAITLGVGETIKLASDGSAGYWQVGGG